MSKKTSFLLAIAITATLAAGCSDGKGNLKQDMQNSLSKQSEMKSYSFTGNADIDLGSVPADAGANPAVGMIVSMFQKSKMEWNGVSSSEPVRLETTLKATPSVSSTPLELPVLLKDNKIYLSLPGINKPEEYFSYDLSAVKTGMNADKMKNATQTSSQMIKLLVSDLDEKWFKKSKEVPELKDGKKGSVTQVEITDKNKKEITDKLRAKYPEMIDTLQQSGFITEAQAAKLKQNGAKSLQVNAPGLLSFTTDDTGFIRVSKLNLSYASADASGAAIAHHVNFQQTYDDINGTSVFKKELPKTVRPLEEILKLIAPVQTPSKK